MKINFNYCVKWITFIAVLTFFTAPAIAGDGGTLPNEKSAANASSRTLWKWSVAAYATANALDVGSSIGPHNGHEQNFFLTNSNGSFDTGKAIAFKGGVVAATGIVEYLLIRKYPQLTKAFSIVNFGWSAAETGVAATISRFENNVFG